MSNTNFVTDTELDAWIDDSHKELYALIVEAYPDAFTASTDTTTGSSSRVSLTDSGSPASYKIRGVDLDPDTSKSRRVPRFNFSERHALNEISYKDLGLYLEFWPASRAAGRSVRIYYVPAPVMLDTGGVSGLSDHMDMWREYIVTEVAAKCLEKDRDFEGSQLLRARKGDLEAKLIALAPEDVGEPEQVANMFAVDTADTWGWE